MTIQKPFIIAVSNRKGGTGKTTTVMNVAAAAAREGFRVLLIDLDTQGHSHFGLGVQVTKGQWTVHDLFRSERRLQQLSQAVVTTAIEGLDVIPADVNYDGSDSTRQSDALKAALAAPEIQDHYDLILLDTPPALDLVLINAMVAADAVLVPVVPHVLSVEGVKQLIRLFFKIASSLNPNLKDLAFVPVMLNLRTGLHKIVLKELSTQYGKERILRGVRSDISLAEAFGKRQPIQLYDPRSRGAQDYQYVWEQLLEIWPTLRTLKKQLNHRGAFHAHCYVSR